MRQLREFKAWLYRFRVKARLERRRAERREAREKRKAEAEERRSKQLVMEL